MTGAQLWAEKLGSLGSQPNYQIKSKPLYFMEWQPLDIKRHLESQGIAQISK